MTKSKSEVRTHILRIVENVLADAPAELDIENEFCVMDALESKFRFQAGEIWRNEMHLEGKQPLVEKVGIEEANNEELVFKIPLDDIPF